MSPCPAIDESQKLHSHSPITEKGSLKAICQLASDKPPRPDGFSIEFYMCFWDDLTHPFMECLKYSINKNQLRKSQYEGVITLLPKLGKDLLLACNERPIAVLNCDHKIISKVINNRLCPLLPSSVNHNQSGFIKPCLIGDNVRLMFDIIDYANCKNVPSAVLSIDVQKAFDSLNWSFILAMLRTYGFGDFLIDLIKMIYKGPKCCLINSNFLRSFFNVIRGVRQGDPLSPTIFSLSIEHLAILFRRSNLYKGLTIPKHCFEVSFRADDTVIYLNGKPSQFNHAFDTLRKFGERFGCKANIDKSTAFYIGSSKVNVVKAFSA